MAKKSRKKSGSRVKKLRNDARQRAFPPEFRIACAPGKPDLGEFVGDDERSARTPSPQDDQPTALSLSRADATVLAELATCLWYLRTRHFKRAWSDEDTGDDDPRVRRALGRLGRGVASLRSVGIEIQDLTGGRFPSGGESFMNPIEMTPTAGLGFERIGETVQPAVYWRDRLIQRGEVFVEVPENTAATERDDHAENDD